MKRKLEDEARRNAPKGDKASDEPPKRPSDESMREALKKADDIKTRHEAMKEAKRGNDLDHAKNKLKKLTDHLDDLQNDNKDN